MTSATGKQTESQTTLSKADLEELLRREANTAILAIARLEKNRLATTVVSRQGCQRFYQLSTFWKGKAA